MSTGRNGIKQFEEYLNNFDISKQGEKKKTYGEDVKDDMTCMVMRRRKAKGPITSLSGVPNKCC